MWPATSRVDPEDALRRMTRAFRSPAFAILKSTRRNRACPCKTCHCLKWRRFGRPQSGNKKGMKPAFLLALPCVFLASCVYAQTDAGTPTVAPNHTQTLPIPSKSTQAAPGQSGQLLTPRDTYKVGRTVPVQFVVANNGKTSVAYNFPTGQQYDITAAGTDNKVVWNWSKGKIFTQGISRLALQPGQKQIFTVTWSGKNDAGKPVPPGAYTLTGRLLSNNGPAITGSLVVNNGPAITGSLVVNNDPDPNNMGHATHTPADTGAVRQVDVLPPVTATKTVTLTK